MTPSNRTPDLPGARLLTLARLVFDEPVVSSAIAPAIADLQHDVREAGASRRRRLAARCRGYWSVWVLMLLLPLALAFSPGARSDRNALRGRSGGATLAVLVAVLFASTWGQFLGVFVAGTIVGGVLLAVTLRWWHSRHPSTSVDAEPLALNRAPEINLSSIRVAGNIGGLMFAVGSTVIVMLGLPELRWFFLAAVAGGLVVAAVLFRWRGGHPFTGLPENSIVTRR